MRFFIFLLCFHSINLFCQTTSVDSMLKKLTVLGESKKDLEEKGGIYNMLGENALFNGDKAKALFYYEQKAQICEKLKDTLGTIEARYQQKASIYAKFGIYDSALVHLQEFNKRIKNIKINNPYMYVELGNLYFSMELFRSAIEAYKPGLKIAKEQKNYECEALIYNNYGLIYRITKKLDSALYWHNKAYELRMNVNKDKFRAAFSLLDIGNDYYDLANDTLTAKKYYSRALNYVNTPELDAYNGASQVVIILPVLCINLMDIYTAYHKYDSVEYYYDKAKYFANKYSLKNNLLGIKLSYILYLVQKGELNKAENMLKSIENEYIAKGNKKIKAKLTPYFYELYVAKKEKYKMFEYGYAYYKRKDSLANSEDKEKFIRTSTLMMQLENEQKIEAQKSMLDQQAQQLKYEAKIKKYMFLVVFLILAITGVIIYFLRKAKQLNNKLLVKNAEISQQKEEIQAQADMLKLVNTQLEQQSEEINAQAENLKVINATLEQQKEELIIQSEKLAELNKELTHKKEEKDSSIRYAQRIQQAILPMTESIKESVKDTFIFYKPKDIVSGDFYWHADKGDISIFAAIDCTGHGVPGAFMSLIGESLLNQIVHDYDIYQPDMILSHLHKGIQKALQQQNSQTNDGMDAVIVTWNKKTKELQYAGAMNSLYYSDNGKIHELKADKMPIGGVLLEGKEPVFTLHSIKVDNPVTLYLASDGFQDQFGGNENKKFMKKALREMLQRIHNLPMSLQEQVIKDKFEQWKGNNEQTDDVLVWGLHFN